MLLEPRGHGGKKPSLRQRIDARESAVDASRRAITEESDLFWYTLAHEDDRAALRALLGGAELACPIRAGPAGLARLVLDPSERSVARCMLHSDSGGVLRSACAFVLHRLVTPVENGDEAFYDAMTAASRGGARSAVIEAARHALHAWWIDGDDIACRLADDRA